MARTRIRADAKNSAHHTPGLMVSFQKATSPATAVASAAES